LAGLADVVEKVLGEGVRRVVWSVGQLEEELKAEPDDGLRKYRLVFAGGKGVAWPMEKTFNEKKGIKVMGVEEWARANLEKWT